MVKLVTRRETVLKPDASSAIKVVTRRETVQMKARKKNLQWLHLWSHQEEGVIDVDNPATGQENVLNPSCVIGAMNLVTRQGIVLGLVTNSIMICIFKQVNGI